MRRFLKNVIFWTYINLIRPLPRWYLALRNRQRVVVLVYHRVNDDLRDSLTVSIEQFEEQMAWLARHCDVVSIEDIINGNVARNANKPLVAVTFDDGYADNHDNAIPILKRHGIPACFFVCTGMIGTDNGFAHDLSMLGHAVPAMSWEQLRRARDLGFSIGSHTVSHLNCGSADIDAVRHELIESRDTLRQKLDLEALIFAYPFGGKSDITPEAMDEVRQAGYVGCVSAYGGCVTDRIDPWDVPRTGISSGFNMLAFRARLQGGFCR